MILKNLLVGLPAMLLCMFMQVAFAFWSVRHYVRRSIVETNPSGAIKGMRPLLAAMLVMMTGTILQIVLWGLLFVVLGEFDEVYESIYHSAVNFASLGYGDIVMSEDWKMLGPLEAVCGVLMLSMTAAALMAIMQQMIKAQGTVASASRR
jgi:Ion channel